VIVLRFLAFLVGAFIVGATILSAVRTFVLPRAQQVHISRVVFLAVRRVLRLLAPPSAPYEQQDRVMALFAPLSLLMLPAAWIVLEIVGFTGMMWGVGEEPWRHAFVVSGSSLLTLGYERPDHLAGMVLSFAAASLGLGLVALLISYLPPIYAAFSRRETAVSLLEALAGAPPSAMVLIRRHHRILGLDRLEKLWERWEEWFADVEESHTSLSALVFFRSPLPHRSWVTAAGCVLDAASLTVSCLDRPASPAAQLCIRSGFVALRRIADSFTLPYDPNPKPDDPISIRRDEFDKVWDAMAADGIPMKANRERAWRDFAGWRVNYDTVLRGLASVTMAPDAPWSSDRRLPLRVPAFWSKGAPRPPSED
jgi:hypothetical protein